MFDDMKPPIESHMRKNNVKNTVGPNENTDLEKFHVERTENIKTIFGTNLPNHPGDGITLRQNRSTSHIPTIRGTRARSERPPATPEKYTEMLGNDMSKQNFRFLSFNEHADFSKKNWSRDSMTPKLVRINLWRYAFVWRYDPTNRKPHAKKNIGKIPSDQTISQISRNSAMNTTRK